MPVADTAFAGLPLSVKAGVLRYVVGKHVESPAEWKQQLRLLAVCSKWRALALPLVYGNIFIACSGLDDDDNADEDSDELRDGDPSKAVFTTNIDLVVKMGQHRKARCLCLRMDYEMGLVPFVRKVQSLLRIVSRCWESVERVHVELISNADPRRAELSGEAIELASDLASVLPRVTRLYANADVEDDVCRLFAGTLVSAYAHQLAACSCYVKIEPNMPPFSEKLARMVVRVNEKSVPHAPCIRAGSLASLHFTDTADDSIWSMFVGPDGSSDAASTIEFTNLRHLHMMTVDNDGDDEDTQDGKVVHQLAFPRLSLLKLNLSQPAARLLARSRLPSRLDKLEVMSFRAGAAALHNTHIGASEQMQLSALIGSDEAAAFWNMANFLFGTEGLGGYSQLLIANATNIPEPDQLAWANLTKLEIMPTIESSYLLRLIQRLPSTEELIVHNLAFTVAPASEPILAVAEPGAHPVAPLNTRIRILRLNYRQTAENGKHGLELIKRLLPRLPAVDEIFMPHFPCEFYEFVAEFGPAYPHIAAFSPDDDVPA